MYEFFIKLCFLLKIDLNESDEEKIGINLQTQRTRSRCNNKYGVSINIKKPENGWEVVIDLENWGKIKQRSARKKPISKAFLCHRIHDGLGLKDTRYLWRRDVANLEVYRDI